MTNVAESTLVEQGAIPPEDFHDFIERTDEVAAWELEIQPDMETRLARFAAELLIAPELLRAAAAALSAGHLVLQGPPGTGKSSLARVLCRAFMADRYEVTAHEDWTTFEVIGRQELRVSDRGEEIMPVNGHFTEAAIRCAGQIVRHFDHPDEPQATWLIVDELNRAHIDKAFGELFTVLGTDEVVPITLPHQRAGNRVLVTPRRFRVIATLNSIDRQFVNSLGQGLKRRFTFLTVDVPPHRRAGEVWGSDHEGASLASREFTVVVRRAARNVARRTAPDDADRRATEYVELVNGPARPHVEALFSLAETVRYAGRNSQQPFLPIGTAQLIDTVELFLTRTVVERLDPAAAESAMDWAASVKLSPLFDTDAIRPEDLERFADALREPFDGLMRRELCTIVAAGQYAVE